MAAASMHGPYLLVLQAREDSWRSTCCCPVRVEARSALARPAHSTEVR